MTTLPNRSKWRIEHSVPLAVITGLMVQLIVFVWMASKYDSRITDTEIKIGRLELHEAENRTPLQLISERLARIEGKLEYVVISRRFEPNDKP
jgi:hypothetical protein